VYCVGHCVLCGTLWTVSDTVDCVGHCGLCETMWTLWDTVDYAGHRGLCATLWTVRDSVDCAGLCASVDFYAKTTLTVHCKSATLKII
jgi:hypothetical protein